MQLPPSLLLSRQLGFHSTFNSSLPVSWAAFPRTLRPDFIWGKKKTQQILSGFCYWRDDKSPVFQLLYCFWINIVSYSYMLSRKSQSVSLSRSIKWWGTCQGSTLWKTVSTVNSRPPRGNTNTPVTLTQQRTVKTAALLHLRLLRILWKVTVLILGFFRVTLLLVFDVIRSSHIFLLERDKLRCHM